MGHYDPLRRAFSNILRNAVEACEERGTLEITVRAGRRGRSADRDLAIMGPAIPPDIGDRIFDPYFTGKTGGTGLGLALVKQTIEMHGGTIEVRETPRRRRHLRGPDPRTGERWRAGPPGR